MAERQYEVRVYYSTYVTHQVQAANLTDALKKARQLPVNQTEIIDHLEPWKDADEVDEGEA